MLTRERETIVTENGDLQHELDMYKSVVVPIEHRPRTNITRVTRAPFANLTQSLNTGGLHPTVTQHHEDHVDTGKVNAVVRAQILETVPGDMTLDEIM
jgi:hypothetical protein